MTLAVLRQSLEKSSCCARSQQTGAARAVGHLCLTFNAAAWFVALGWTCLLLVSRDASAVDAESPGRFVIQQAPVPLRNKPEREWSDFAETPPATQFRRVFSAKSSSQASALIWRQRDVKQAWSIRLNGQKLGELVRDENDMTVGVAIPPGMLRDEKNELLIEAAGNASADDVILESIECLLRPLPEILAESHLEITVTDVDSREPLPCRITILNERGSLAALGTASNDDMAIRPGTAYLARGTGKLALPAGRYSVFAGRGFEYSLARAEVDLSAGAAGRVTLALQREVPTPGYVACDTHIHTLTHSGHGDASLTERMITLAGEGIELPVFTDHNVAVDGDPEAQRLNLRRYFTPVIGNEVTTPRGHFNIFPVTAGAPAPDATLTDWTALFDAIARTPGVKFSILNHARDLHRGVRPFAPVNHNALLGQNLDGWPFRFEGMEVINSGATQTEPLQLVQDWMNLLNRGYRITPIGSSDSHDVARHFVGQARTYVRCDDRDPATLDVDAAITSLRQGRVRVSYGLLTELTVNDRFSSGELATVGDAELRLTIRVLGPRWVRADRVLLFQNGQVIREEVIPAGAPRPEPRTLWEGTWTVPRPGRDVHLVAVATGPGIDGLYWRTAKPYQPLSPDPRTGVMGCSGAVWVDADRDGLWTSPSAVAAALVADAGSDLPRLLKELADCDMITAAHAAARLQMTGRGPSDPAVQTALKQAAPSVRSGFQEAWDAQRLSDRERAQREAAKAAASPE